MRRNTIGAKNMGSKPKDKPVARPRSSIPGSRLSTSRPSTSFGGSSRRSSQYGRDSYSQVKDPRPISEKSYQQKEIKEIIQFLSQNDYDQQISAKVLTCPTTKEFLKVFMFIYGFLDQDQSHHKVILKRPDEEVPKILKSLGYPFTIHKTSLSNVGSPHTWPILLAALHWLMNLVKFGLRVKENIDEYLFPLGDEEEDFGERKEDRLYFEYLEKSYAAFLNGKELEELGSYTEAFQEEIRSKNLPMITEMERLAQENLQLEKDLAELDGKPSKLEALTEQKTNLEADSTKLQVYISDLQRHKAKLEERAVESEEAFNVLKLEQEATASEKVRVQKELDKQELSAADVQRMKKEKGELKKTVEKLENQRDQLDQECWEMEMAYAKRRDQCVAYLEDYNKRATKLKLIPKTAENAAGADYELKCNLGKMSLDFKTLLKPNLSRFKQQISDSNRYCQSEIFTLKEKHDQLQEQITEKAEDISTTEKDIRVLEKEYDWKKQLYDQQNKKLTEKEEKLQEELQNMRQSASVGILEKQRELDDLKEQLAKRRKEMETEKTQYEMFLHAACEKIVDHKMIISNRVAEVRKDSEEFLSYVESIPEPHSEWLNGEKTGANIEQ